MSARKLINYQVQRQFFEQTKEGIRQGRADKGFVVRAQVRLLQDCLKEVRVGPFRFLSDEGPPRGWGAAPAPLHYLIAAVGL